MALKPIASLLLVTILLVFPANAQSSKTKPVDKETERVQAMIKQARSEAEEFSKTGKPADANHPNLKWSKTLWSYSRKHKPTHATALATAESLRLLVRIDRVTEMQAQADTLKLTDPAWRQVLYVLLSAANRTKDFSYFVNKTEALTKSANDPDIKARARFIQGEGYWGKGDIERAKVAFQTVVTQHPKTSYADEAEGNLREIEFLNLGQPAPLFERNTINGEAFSLASLKGQIVVLKFWGTY